MFGYERFHCYVYGRPVQTDSDHKPLEIIATKSLCKASSRLKRLLLRLQKYDTTINYVPGNNMEVADTLSRAFLNEGPDAEKIFQDMDKMIPSLVETLPMSEERLTEMKTATARDDTLQTLITYVKNGLPLRTRVQALIRSYCNIRDEVYEAKGLLFLGQKLIVPQELRKNILQCIHKGHLGIKKCKSAQDKFYIGQD